MDSLVTVNGRPKLDFLLILAINARANVAAHVERENELGDPLGARSATQTHGAAKKEASGHVSRIGLAEKK
jgi:hypothetical protein